MPGRQPTVSAVRTGKRAASDSGGRAPKSASYSALCSFSTCWAVYRRELFISTGDSITPSGWLYRESRRPSQVMRRAWPTSSKEGARRRPHPAASEICWLRVRLSASSSLPEKAVSKNSRWPNFAAAGSSARRLLLSGGGGGSWAGAKAANLERSMLAPPSDPGPTAWGPPQLVLTRARTAVPVRRVCRDARIALPRGVRKYRPGDRHRQRGDAFTEARRCERSGHHIFVWFWQGKRPKSQGGGATPLEKPRLS